MDPLQWLPEFHRFFVWFLKIVYGEVKLLKKLRLGKVIRAALPGNAIKHAFGNLVVLKFFSWQSDFFASYISAAFATGTCGPDDTAAKTTPAELTSGQEKDVFLSDHGVGESQTADEEEDLGLDISTEFEGQTSATTPLEDIHPCVLELRLVTSNIRHIETLLNRAPRSRFRFHVIQYAPSGQLLKPWRELVQELFPREALRKAILKTLEDTPGDAFQYFRPGGPPLIFKGQAHCEAVLGCLFSLTKRDEDITWVPLHPHLLYIPRLTVNPPGWYTKIRPGRPRYLLQPPCPLQTLLYSLRYHHLAPLRRCSRCRRHGYPRP